jgi:hypothetical protein
LLTSKFAWQVSVEELTAAFDAISSLTATDVTAMFEVSEIEFWD